VGDRRGGGGGSSRDGCSGTACLRKVVIFGHHIGNGVCNSCRARTLNESGRWPSSSMPASPPFSSHSSDSCSSDFGGMLVRTEPSLGEVRNGGE